MFEGFNDSTIKYFELMVQYAQKRRQPLIFRGLPIFLLLISY